MYSATDTRRGSPPVKENTDEIAPQSRDILRQYKALINARRRDAGQRELTTAQVMDEICEYMTCQCAVYIGGHFILQGGKGTVSTMAGAGGEGACLPARKPGQAAPAGEASPRLRRRALSSPLSVDKIAKGDIPEFFLNR
jgi:hypothetical protein